MRRLLRVRDAVGVGLMVLVLAALAGDTAAQVATEQPVAQMPLRPLGVSPTGAFLRSALVPGWGHAAIGAYGRGGFYIALESVTAYTFLRTRRRLSEARERAAFREGTVRADLAREGITEPQEIEDRLSEDETLNSFQDLVDSREGQQEDLVAFGLFLIFLSGADAYVSAHLARFPAPIELQVSPVGSGRAEVAISIPLPNLR
jgi:hypothetical protein